MLFALILNSMAVAELTLPSFAKINWSLYVAGKRPDGFHNIFTVFQTVSLHDSLTFSKFDEVVFSCSDRAIPTDDRNLVVRALNALREQASTSQGIRIHLEKRIPSPGGLGGGSSNAAVALIGASKLWGLGPLGLEDIGRRIGSDVPFFLHGGTALGTDRGDQIHELPQISEQFLLIVTPDVVVPTADAYGALRPDNLTNLDPDRILQNCRFAAESSNFRRSALANDLEDVVLGLYPEIARAKKLLLELGAAAAQMSGSGASIFALFDKEETRQTALKALDNESTWRKFAVATITRDEYGSRLGLSNPAEFDLPAPQSASDSF